MKCTGERRYDSSGIQSYYHLRSRHPNSPGTEHVPATEVLGIGSDSGEAAKTASESVS